jgi:hypothetical protein
VAETAPLITFLQEDGCLLLANFVSMQRSGSADLPLHNGYVPKWLYERMAKLGFAITEAIITEYGRAAFLSKMSDPFWFQSFGAVMGMDWHSSGITTSVMGALKRALNPHAKDLGFISVAEKENTLKKLQKSCCWWASKPASTVMSWCD